MNRRECLKGAGLLSAAVILALYGSPSDAAEPQPVNVLVTYHSVSGNTEKMAQGVVEGGKAVSGTSVVLKRAGEVIGDDLLSADAVIIGSPVYVGNMSGQVKTFFDNWGPKFGLGTATRQMRNKVGAAFANGGFSLQRKEITMLTILAAMLDRHQRRRAIRCERDHQPDSPGIDAKEIAEARDLGKRVAEVAALVKRGSSK